MTTSTAPMNLLSNLQPEKRNLFLLALFLGISFLILYHIDLYPGPFYDEGADLHVAKNFANSNLYADYSSEGARPYGPSLGTGPALLLVTGILYKVFGVSFTVARLLVALYSLGTVLVVYKLGSHLMNRRLAILAVLLVVLTPGLSMWQYGRMAMGEVPGLFFTLLALLIWLRTQSHQTGRLIFAGILFGCVATTKNQFAMVVLPALLVCWLADLVWYRQRGWKYFVIPGVVAGLMYAGWLYAIMFLIASPDSAANISAVQGTSAYALFVWQIREALSFLISRSAFGFMMLPAIIHGVVISRMRTRAGQEWGILTIFVIVGIVFYMSSLGWPRYAFLAMGLASLLVARLVYRLTNGLRLDLDELKSVLHGHLALRPIVSYLTWGLTILFLLFSAYTYVHELTSASMSDAYATAAYLQTNVQTDAVIETWEQELSVLTDHRYHFPPQFVDAERGREDVLGLPEGATSVRDRYDFQDYSDATYVVVGPVGTWSGLYTEERLHDFDLMQVIGAYHIYKKH